MDTNNNPNTKPSHNSPTPSPSKAQLYIEHHKLEPLIAEMLNTLVYHKIRVNPEIVMIKYLASLLTPEQRAHYGIKIGEDNKDSQTVTTQYIKPIPVVKFPSDAKSDVIKRELSRELWNSIKYAKTKFGANVNDVIFPHDKVGVRIPDADVSKS